MSSSTNLVTARRTYVAGDWSVFGLELIEATSLGILGGLAVRPAGDHVILAGLLGGGAYLILLGFSYLWQHSRSARCGLTWLTLGSIFFLLLLLDLNRTYLLSAVTPQATTMPRLSELTREWLAGLSWLGFLFLYAPIAVLVLFSFNQAIVTAGGRVLSATVWQGFTVDWYRALLQNERIIDAAYNSLLVGLISTALATVIGTMVALAMSHYHFPGKLLLDGLLTMPIIIPDIVMALSLILFFVLINVGALVQELITMVGQMAFLPPVVAGLLIRLIRLTPIIIAHVVFNISFVAIVVRARLADFDLTLLEAAQDLYATEWQAFRWITLPLIVPGILAGALLAFTLSIDDFVITFFVAGPGATTLPVRVYSMIRIGVTPEVNAISTVMLVVSIGLLLGSLLLQRRSWRHG